MISAPPSRRSHCDSGSNSYASRSDPFSVMVLLADIDLPNSETTKKILFFFIFQVSLCQFSRRFTGSSLG